MADSNQPTSIPPLQTAVSPAERTLDAEVARELAALRKRVESLERAVGLAPQPVRADAPPTVASIAPTAPQPSLLDAIQRAARDTALSRSPAESTTATASASTPRLSFEQLVGTRWYAAAGALTLVVGLALFAKLAYDQGWLRIPPGPRCVLVAIAGALLITAGEVVRRRFTRVGSIGLYAAGLGALYAAPLAATRLYTLVHPGIAFLLLIAISSLGVLIAARLRFILVAFLSLVGAYMAPILLSTGAPSYVVYPAYLLLLLATGLFLSAYLRGDFVRIRTLVWFATVLLGGFWTLDDGYQAPMNGLAGVLFPTIAWLLVHAEILLAARAQPANPELAPQAPGPISIAGPAPRPFWRSLALSLSTSTWAGLLVTLVLRSTNLLPDWAGVAGFSVGSALAALVLAGHLRFMIDRPSSATERLGAVLGVEAAAMAIIAVALGLTGLGEIIAYMVIAAGVLVASAWLRSVPLLLYACAIGAILTARLIVYDSMTALHRMPFDVAGLAITTWSGLMVVTAAIWAFAAACVLRLGDRSRGDESPADPVLSSSRARLANLGLLVLGTACAMASLLHPDASAPAIATAWLILAAGLSSGNRFTSRWPLGWVALAPLGLSLVPWLVTIVNRSWDNSSLNGIAGQAIVRPQFLVALAIIAGASLLPPQLRVADLAQLRRAVVLAGRCIAAGMFLGCTSAEAALITSRLTTDTTTQAATISIWWALVAVGAVVAGFAAQTPVVRRLGLSLLGIAAIKVIAFDLADVTPVARIASFISLGVLMLAVAVIYGRVSRHLEGPAPAPTVPPAAR